MGAAFYFCFCVFLSGTHGWPAEPARSTDSNYCRRVPKTEAAEDADAAPGRLSLAECGCQMETEWVVGARIACQPSLHRTRKGQFERHRA